MIPWFCVVTNPVKEGFGMSHFEKSTQDRALGLDPAAPLAGPSATRTGPG